MLRRATLVGALSLMTLVITPQALTAQEEEEGPPINLPITQRDLPSTGFCRVWVANPEQVGQSKDFSCRNIEYSAPLGSYLFMRKKGNREDVYLCYMSRSERGVIDGIDVFSYSRLRLLRVVLPRTRRSKDDTMKCMDAEKDDG